MSDHFELWAWRQYLQRPEVAELCELVAVQAPFLRIERSFRLRIPHTSRRAPGEAPPREVPIRCVGPNLPRPTETATQRPVSPSTTRMLRLSPPSPALPPHSSALRDRAEGKEEKQEKGKGKRKGKGKNPRGTFVVPTGRHLGDLTSPIETTFMRKGHAKAARTAACAAGVAGALVAAAALQTSPESGVVEILVMREGWQVAICKVLAHPHAPLSEARRAIEEYFAKGGLLHRRRWCFRGVTPPQSLIDVEREYISLLGTADIESTAIAARQERMKLYGEEDALGREKLERRKEAFTAMMHRIDDLGETVRGLQGTLESWRTVSSQFPSVPREGRGRPFFLVPPITLDSQGRVVTFHEVAAMLQQKGVARHLTTETTSQVARARREGHVRLPVLTITLLDEDTWYGQEAMAAVEAETLRDYCDPSRAVDTFEDWLRALAEPRGSVFGIHTTLNFQDTILGWSPLHYAARNGHAPPVPHLLRSGADPALQDWRGQTAVHIAAARGEEAVLRALLSHTRPATRPESAASGVSSAGGTGTNTASVATLSGVEVEEVDDESPRAVRDPRGRLKEGALRAGRRSSAGYIAAVQGITAGHPAPHLIKDRQGDTPLVLAAQNGHLECVLLLAKEVTTDTLRQTDRFGVRTIDRIMMLLCPMQAAHDGDERTVRLWYSVLGWKAGDTDSFSGRTLLGWAAAGGQARLCGVLVGEFGERVSRRSKVTGWNPLHEAVAKGRLSAVQAMLEHIPEKAHPRVLRVRTRGKGYSLLHLASAKDAADLVQLPLDASAVDCDGRNILHVTQDSAVLDAVLSRLANVEGPRVLHDMLQHRDLLGDTPLGVAIKSHSLHAALVLLTHGAPLTPCSLNRPPLILAIDAGNTAVCSSIVTPDLLGDGLLRAVQVGNFEVAAMLFAKGAVATAHHFTLTNDVVMIRLLLANLQCALGEDNEVLATVVRHHTVEVLDLVLSALHPVANPTVLHVACSRGGAVVERILDRLTPSALDPECLGRALDTLLHRDAAVGTTSEVPLGLYSKGAKYCSSCPLGALAARCGYWDLVDLAVSDPDCRWDWCAPCAPHSRTAVHYLCMAPPPEAPQLLMHLVGHSPGSVCQRDSRGRLPIEHAVCCRPDLAIHLALLPSPPKASLHIPCRPSPRIPPTPAQSLDATCSSTHLTYLQWGGVPLSPLPLPSAILALSSSDLRGCPVLYAVHNSHFHLLSALLTHATYQHVNAVLPHRACGVPQGATPLWLAAAKGCRESCRMLLEHPELDPVGHGETAAGVAYRMGWASLAKTILTATGCVGLSAAATVDMVHQGKVVTVHGVTPLVAHALTCSTPERLAHLSWLVENRATVGDLRTTTPISPLHLLLATKPAIPPSMLLVVFRTLLAAPGGKHALALHRDDDQGRGVLEYALAADQRDLALLLIREHQCTPWYGKGGCALHVFANRRDREGVEAVVFFPTKGDLDRIDYRTGSTALHLSLRTVSKQGTAIAILLLQQGASPFTLDRMKRSPLSVACRAGNTKAVNVLLRYMRGKHRGALNGGVVGTGGWINEGVVDPCPLASVINLSADSRGLSPLHNACISGSYSTVLELMLHGGDLLAPPISPIAVAIDHGHDSLATRLIRETPYKHVVLEYQTKHGETLMHLAARRGLTGVVKLLCALDTPSRLDTALTPGLCTADDATWGGLNPLAYALLFTRGIVEGSVVHFLWNRPGARNHPCIGTLLQEMGGRPVEDGCPVLCRYTMSALLRSPLAIYCYGDEGCRFFGRWIPPHNLTVDDQMWEAIYEERDRDLAHVFALGHDDLRTVLLTGLPRLRQIQRIEERKAAILDGLVDASGTESLLSASDMGMSVTSGGFRERADELADKLKKQIMSSLVAFNSARRVDLAPPHEVAAPTWDRTASVVMFTQRDAASLCSVGKLTLFDRFRVTVQPAPLKGPSYREGIKEGQRSVLHEVADRGLEKALGALIEGHTEVLDGVSEINPWFVTALSYRDNHGYTPLHYAIARSRFSMVKTLLAAGASPDTRDIRSGLTPFSFVASPAAAHLLQRYMGSGMTFPDTPLQIVSALVEAESYKRLSAQRSCERPPFRGEATDIDFPHFGDNTDSRFMAGDVELVAVVRLLNGEGHHRIREACIKGLVNAADKPIRAAVERQLEALKGRLVDIAEEIWEFCNTHPETEVLGECVTAVPELNDYQDDATDLAPVRAAGKALYHMRSVLQIHIDIESVEGIPKEERLTALSQLLYGVNGGTLGGLVFDGLRYLLAQSGTYGRLCFVQLRAVRIAFVAEPALAAAEIQSVGNGEVEAILLVYCSPSGRLRGADLREKVDEYFSCHEVALAKAAAATFRDFLTSCHEWLANMPRVAVYVHHTAWATYTRLYRAVVSCNKVELLRLQAAARHISQAERSFARHALTEIAAGISTDPLDPAPAIATRHSGRAYPSPLVDFLRTEASCVNPAAWVNIVYGKAPQDTGVMAEVSGDDFSETIDPMPKVGVKMATLLPQMPGGVLRLASCVDQQGLPPWTWDLPMSGMEKVVRSGRVQARPKLHVPIPLTSSPTKRGEGWSGIGLLLHAALGRTVAGCSQPIVYVPVTPPGKGLPPPPYFADPSDFPWHVLRWHRVDLFTTETKFRAPPIPRLPRSPFPAAPRAISLAQKALALWVQLDEFARDAEAQSLCPSIQKPHRRLKVLAGRIVCHGALAVSDYLKPQHFVALFKVWGSIKGLLALRGVCRAWWHGVGGCLPEVFVICSGWAADLSRAVADAEGPLRDAVRAVQSQMTPEDSLWLRRVLAVRRAGRVGWCSEDAEFDLGLWAEDPARAALACVAGEECPEWAPLPTPPPHLAHLRDALRLFLVPLFRLRHLEAMLLSCIGVFSLGVLRASAVAKHDLHPDEM